MWKWRDMFLGVNYTKRDTDLGLELASESSHPEAQWLCRLFPYNPRNDTVIETLTRDNSAVGYFYASMLLKHAGFGVAQYALAIKLGYPLTLGSLQIKCEEYGWAQDYWVYSMTFKRSDPRRYLWQFKLLGYNGLYTCTQMISNFEEQTMPDIIYSVGLFILTESIHPVNRGIFVEPVVVNALRVVYDTHDYARSCIILWILWAKRHINLVNRDVRKMIAREIWKDRIKFADLVY